MIIAALMMAAAAVTAEPAAAVEPTAAELIENCRAMLPQRLEASGRVIVRNRRGIVKSEHAYVLKRDGGLTALTLDGNAVTNLAIEGSAVCWSDLTLEYLGWKDVAYDAAAEEESVHGQKCRVVVIREGERRVRAWIDRKTGALMQAEETAADGSVRRLWGTRLKKFNERWVPSVLEVETVGTGLRTKITVEEMK